MTQEQKESLNYCRCGCGREIPQLTSKNKPRLYARGHSERSDLNKFSVQVECACGCKELIFKYDRVGREMRYKKGHFVMKGSDNVNWNGGKFLRGGYIYILDPEHPNADPRGYISEHVKVMSEHLGRRLEEGEEVHHKDKNKLNNSIENLQLFSSKGEHLRHEYTQDLSDRVCYQCGSSETRIDPNNRPHWYKFENDKRICHKCYCKNYYSK